MKLLPAWHRLRPAIDTLELLVGAGLILWGISRWSVPLAAVVAGAALISSQLLNRRP